MSNSIGRRLFGTKSIETLHEQIAKIEYKKTLSALDLTFLGIGAIIGAGIFVLTGTAAKDHAGMELIGSLTHSTHSHQTLGPALVISFLIAGFVCGLGK